MMVTRYQSVLAIALLAILIPSIVCPPVKSDKTVKDHEQKAKVKKDHPDINDEEYGLEYERYLKEIFTVLEEDDTFKNKIMKDPDLKASDISQHLEFVSHNVRTKLDEIKRTEVERLRALTHLKVKQLKGINFPNKVGVGGGPEDGRVLSTDHKQLKGRGIRESLEHILTKNEHLDLTNPHTFEMKDLDRLINKATSDLEALDTDRKQDFKKYEMEKEHERRKKMAHMSPEERKKEEEHDEELKKKHKDHPKLHEPGSKAQLEDVWEGEDHMDKDSFDPKTFFNMHDTDGDGHLEPDEVEAIMEREVSKEYEPGHEEDDLNEKYEEIMRMREDMFKRYDKNHDGLISSEEFLEMSKTKDFEEDDGWKGLDDQDNFSPDEFEQFEKEHEVTPPSEHHEQPGVAQMNQGQPEHAQPDQGHQAQQGQGHQAQQGQEHQAQQGQEHQATKPPSDQGHVPPGQAGDHVQPPIQQKAASEQHAPPQHPPPRS